VIGPDLRAHVLGCHHVTMRLAALPVNKLEH
jgi:hypothetical protein